MTKLLVIDDQKPILEMMQDHFTPRGFEVLSAETAEEGLRLAFKERPKVILMDYSLCRYTGEDLLIRIKKNLPGIKVIIVTGASDPTLKVRLLALGADAFFFKGEASLSDLQFKLEELSQGAA